MAGRGREAPRERRPARGAPREAPGERRSARGAPREAPGEDATLRHFIWSVDSHSCCRTESGKAILRPDDGSARRRVAPEGARRPGTREGRTADAWVPGGHDRPRRLHRGERPAAEWRTRQPAVGRGLRSHGSASPTRFFVLTNFLVGWIVGACLILLSSKTPPRRRRRWTRSGAGFSPPWPSP